MRRIRPDTSMGNFTLFPNYGCFTSPGPPRHQHDYEHAPLQARRWPWTFSPQYRRTWKKEPTRIRGSIRQVSLLASVATNMMAMWKDTLHLMKPRWGEKPRRRLAKPILWRSDNRCYTFVLRRRQVNKQPNVLSMIMNWEKCEWLK